MFGYILGYGKFFFFLVWFELIEGYLFIYRIFLRIDYMFIIVLIIEIIIFVSMELGVVSIDNWNDSR